MHILLTYNKTTHKVEVLKVYDLPFPVLLGRDAPAFSTLIRSALPQMAVIVDEEERQGP